MTRIFLRLPAVALVAFAVFFSSTPSQAAEPAIFPERPIRIILNGAPGGGLDILSRQLGERLQQAWGQAVITDNRPGAGGNIAFGAVAKAAPDGYTLLLTTDGISAAPSLGIKGAVNPLTDFEAVSLLALTTDVLLVRADSPIKTLADFKRTAIERAAAGKPLTAGSPGPATSSHLSGALYGLRAGIDWTHVPYKGGPPAINDLLSGQTDALWILAAPVVPHVKSGRLRAIAVTSEARNAALPDVPSVAEAGQPDATVVNWLGILAPKGTPRAVIDKLSTELNRIVLHPALRPTLIQQGFMPDGRDAAVLERQIRNNVKLWANVIEQARIRLD
ncbi:Bug family tripartite tricarboxylate transporter substrate binding protein [Ottowia thiooxydans]|uniref:Bug family tripartite tricarboxylate transporter substrate binding protein n=1 Tax=Ottowia thiooxydans TaxID=219182 RepID=UPI00040F3228|nr:tripartite tricarboxylate transporter substrate binding protein [Ottowia thiooxydans]